MEAFNSEVWILLRLKIAHYAKREEPECKLKPSKVTIFLYYLNRPDLIQLSARNSLCIKNTLNSSLHTKTPFFSTLFVTKSPNFKSCSLIKEENEISLKL
eukprot:TRINITY_DN6283_c0_g1_i7.p1 TRINITY_DN6283_c0_g1~~TRINITY_DN6283_c0_g1_i7.p1  ORF type:complete len:100 (+),score=5.36 TRINITY_DN6283_c0_g1_i7:97-396(+)